MSEVFEGAVIPADQGLLPAISARARSLELVSAPVGAGVFVFSRSDPRSKAAFTSVVDKFATDMSIVTGRALVVRFDSRIGHRSAALYANGQLTRSFGPEDERFVPLDDDGEPIRSAVAVKREQFLEGAEYETVSNALQQGLDALGAGEWSLLFDQMTRSS